jgi:hypothetical protein
MSEERVPKAACRDFGRVPIPRQNQLIKVARDAELLDL